MKSTITIQEAIRKGFRLITIPFKIGLILLPIFTIVLLIVYFSWWDFLVVPVIVLLLLIYSSAITLRWKLWAYKNVEDIHQFQRSVELAGLLPKQSYNSTGFLLGKRNKRELEELQKKFLQQPVFVDDVNIPTETIIYSKRFLLPSKFSVIFISDKGININEENFIWSEVSNERIADVSYSVMNPHTGDDWPAGSKSFFRFESNGKYIEVPINSINISAWELDLLLYIYRNRSYCKKGY